MILFRRKKRKQDEAKAKKVIPVLKERQRSYAERQKVIDEIMEVEMRRVRRP